MRELYLSRLVVIVTMFVSMVMTVVELGISVLTASVETICLQHAHAVVIWGLIFLLSFTVQCVVVHFMDDIS